MVGNKTWGDFNVAVGATSHDSNLSGDLFWGCLGSLILMDSCSATHNKNTHVLLMASEIRQIHG